MWVDIRGAAKRYSDDIVDPQLLKRFASCMEHLYPT
jgi:hypothetical protein